MNLLSAKFNSSIFINFSNESGKLYKLFLLKFNFFKFTKVQKSSGMEEILQKKILILPIPK